MVPILQKVEETVLTGQQVEMERYLLKAEMENYLRLVGRVSYLRLLGDLVSDG